MTDMVNEDLPTQGSDSQQKPAEKMLSQSEVNDIVGRVRHEGYQKGQKDALSQLETRQPHPPSASNPANGLSEQDVRRMMAEEARRIQQEQLTQMHAQKVVGEFTTKVNGAKERYPDLEQKIADLDLPKMPELVALANSVDNTGDVIYDLASNPYKVGTILSLMRQGLPHLAQQEMNKLSSSIKENQKAAQAVQQAREPLSQLKSSATTGDGKALGIADLRKQAWLRR